MGTIRVYILARDLGVTSSDIIKKCHVEGKKLLAVKNHMSPLSAHVADTIRAWFEKIPNDVDDYICTIKFPFQVNTSFLKYSHSITIPTKYNSTLKKHVSSGHHEITPLISKCIAISGYVYHYDSRYRPYYQIKIPQKEYRAISKLYHLGQSIDVVLKIYKSSIKVYLKETKE